MQSITLIITLLGLIAVAFWGIYFSKLPKNIWLLFLAQPLAMSSAPMIVFAGGLLASQIASDPSLATLPLTLMILGTASAVIPATMLMRKMGRKNATMIGLLAALIGALFCAAAAYFGIFNLLLVGAIFLGASMAFVAQMRFAAIESLSDPSDSPKAISVLMISGLFAAILGPEVAFIAKDWLASSFAYSGSFLGLSLMLIVSILIISQLQPTSVNQTEHSTKTRSLLLIIKQPIFVIAVCCGVISYSTMSYIMTAAPLSMHEMEGHDLADTKWVIQSHIIAMYLPSLFSAVLIRFVGIAKLMLIGSLMFVLVVLVALMGKQVMHYWWVMVLLGVGWNFLFTSGTLLLPESYQANERFKVQALNDLMIFFAQAMASLSAGFILFKQGWSLLISVSIPAILIMLVIASWYLLSSKTKTFEPIA